MRKHQIPRDKEKDRKFLTLMAKADVSDTIIARRLGVSRQRVGHIRERLRIPIEELRELRSTEVEEYVNKHFERIYG